MGAKKIGLVVKHDFNALRKAHEFDDFLAEKGCRIIRRDIQPPQSGVSLENPFDADIIPAEKDMFCVFVLGGDGTFLSAARWIGSLSIPILGVKFGEVGFLAEIMGDKLFPVAEKILENDFTTTIRSRLRVKVIRKDRVIVESNVLNDVVINKGTLARLAHIETFINDQVVTTYRSDGLIVATPTGSTAYSLAAGGPVIHPDVAGIIITPICPFTLTNRPVIVPDTSHIKIRISPKSSDVILTLDGQEGLSITSEDTILVEKSPYPVKTVVIPDQHFYDVLKAKLKWSGSAV